jgi:2-polyprenyl-3-methyl-5-hydroxy-6-metoxy-1,4-benzoquinol methylase
MMVMRPEDLAEFTRQTYAAPHNRNSLADGRHVGSGLLPMERLLLDRSGVTSGKLLLLGMGGGREAIDLAKRGFSVTGVDWIPALVQRAQ